MVKSLGIEFVLWPSPTYLTKVAGKGPLEKFGLRRRTCFPMAIPLGVAQSARRLAG